MSLTPITRDQALRDAVAALERLRDLCTSINDAGTAEVAIDCLRRLEPIAAPESQDHAGGVRYQWGKP